MCGVFARDALSVPIIIGMGLRGKAPCMTVGAPWERVGIDLTGKHPRSRRGDNYILTYIDYFTKWAEAFPIPNKEAPTVCRTLIKEVFPRYGVPLQVISDPYKASTNGAVEQLHRATNATLGRVVSESQRAWDERVPMVMAAYMASRHEATGYSPNLLTFVREVRAPIDILMGNQRRGNMSIPTHLSKKFVLLKAGLFSGQRTAKEGRGT